ncbi:DUF1643 domain-containing protein [Cupriavidus basilensis]
MATSKASRDQQKQESSIPFDHFPSVNLSAFAEEHASVPLSALNRKTLDVSMKRLIETTIDGETGCLLSDCEKYRSTASGARGTGAARRWASSCSTRRRLTTRSTTPPSRGACSARCNRQQVRRAGGANLFPLRSTDPDALLLHPAPLGDRPAKNVGAIMDALDRCSMVICAWGARQAAPGRAEAVLDVILLAGRKNLLYHLGLNQDGSPRAPSLHSGQHQAATIQRTTEAAARLTELTRRHWGIDK